MAVSTFRFFTNLFTRINHSLNGFRNCLCVLILHENAVFSQKNVDRKNPSCLKGVFKTNSFSYSTIPCKTIVTIVNRITTTIVPKTPATIFFIALAFSSSLT